MAPPRRKRRRRPARVTVPATSTAVEEPEPEAPSPARRPAASPRGLMRGGAAAASASDTAVDPALEWRRPDYFAFSGLIAAALILVAVVLSLLNRDLPLYDYILGLPTGQLSVFFIPACGFIAAPFAMRLRHKRKLRFLEILPFSALIALLNGLVLSLALFLHIGITTPASTATGGVPTPVPGAVTAVASPRPSSAGTATATPSASAAGNGAAVGDLTASGWFAITISAFSGFLIVPVLFPKVSSMLTSGPRRQRPPLRPPPPRGRGR